jgi:hypothetical protein
MGSACFAADFPSLALLRFLLGMVFSSSGESNRWSRSVEDIEGSSAAG